ncbi:PfkB family carbohydrate kinase [Paraglaciecola sp. MB-3u-78]|uniref:PfkB family carbohydrate kinase n=1 Tax=Paraglaciecola sp. MB-3u-78 TaxID=2058332 RepID=UPI000C33CFFC|nr:PfkB family carbohydrate kinase [Paraglaciecola sp. MB-3u-78]PKH00815.1 ADP-heptose synthase [Paraglaciecola sp. MB-3u-78]
MLKQQIESENNLLESTFLGRKVVLVSGNFNILHPGHVRLLRFAKECGEMLVVAVNSDQIIHNPEYLNEEHRLEVISSLEYVDRAFISTQSVENLIKHIKPWAVVKGKEYENTFNPEKSVLEALGGKLIFSSGNSRSSSYSYLGNRPASADVQSDKLNGYLARHKINRDNILDIIDKISLQKVLVIGDTIVDQYVQCSAVGMSQEDPTIVVTPEESKFFLGGAGIVAGHAKSLGAADVSYFSVVGQDEHANFVRQRLNEYCVKPFVYEDDTRPTILKTRYRVGNKTLLRVNEVRSHDISEALKTTIGNALKSAIDTADVVLFSDFNYGMLPQVLVDDIIAFAADKDVILAADSQTSSQVGDISRFKNMHLITPTEREIRVALKNDRDGLVILAQKLTAEAQCKNLFVTLADEGILIHNPINDSHWDNDRVKALAANPVDPAGAGDCLFAASAIAMAAGANIWEAAFIGSVAAACQVSNVGNQPIDAKRFNRAIVQLL